MFVVVLCFFRRLGFYSQFLIFLYSHLFTVFLKFPVVCLPIILCRRSQVILYRFPSSLITSFSSFMFGVLSCFHFIFCFVVLLLSFDNIYFTFHFFFLFCFCFTVVFPVIFSIVFSPCRRLLFMSFSFLMSVLPLYYWLGLILIIILNYRLNFILFFKVQNTPKLVIELSI